MGAATEQRGAPSVQSVMVNYGKTYQEDMEAIIGEPLRGARNIGNCIYLKPAWSAYALNGGRVAIVVQHIMWDTVTIVDDRDAYRQWKDGMFRFDPETGRRG